MRLILYCAVLVSFTSYGIYELAHGEWRVGISSLLLSIVNGILLW